MLWFKKKNAVKYPTGFTKVDEYIPPVIEGNTLISKMMGYKFTLPDGFWFTDERNNVSERNEYIEFCATNGDIKICSFVTLCDGTGMEASWKERGKVLMNAVASRIVRNLHPNSVIYVNFLGKEFANFSGISVREYSDGCRQLEYYFWAAPYMTHAIFGIAAQGDGYKLKNIADSFYKL